MKLNPFKLERYLAQHEFSSRYLLCSSDCESMKIRDILALEPGASERFESLWLGYTEPTGNPELRQVISKMYDHIEADQIIVHAGAEEAIFNFMNVALGQEDHVVVHAPCYQSLGEVARGIGAEVTEWQGDPKQGWQLEIEDLKNILTSRTKVVVVNFPHNPTGYLPDKDFIHQLSALSEKHGFIIFSDEVYRGLEHDSSDRLPALADLNHRAISLGVMSKTFGLAGLRIGWIGTRNKQIFKALQTFKDYTTICNSAPSEFLATIALRHAESIAQRNLQIIRKNLDYLDSFFESHKDRFDWNRPKAGSVAFPDLLKGEVDTFCSDLIEKAGVLLLPGSLYGKGFNSFRVGFGRKNLPEALQRLDDYLKATR